MAKKRGKKKLNVVPAKMEITQEESPEVVVHGGGEAIEIINPKALYSNDKKVMDFNTKNVLRETEEEEAFKSHTGIEGEADKLNSEIEKPMVSEEAVEHATNFGETMGDAMNEIIEEELPEERIEVSPESLEQRGGLKIGVVEQPKTPEDAVAEYDKLYKKDEPTLRNLVGNLIMDIEYVLGRKEFVGVNSTGTVDMQVAYGGIQSALVRLRRIKGKL